MMAYLVYTRLHNTTRICFIILAIFVSVFSVTHVYSQTDKIPSWIKDSTSLWTQGIVTDDEFINMLQYLVTQEILVIPNKQEQSSIATVIPTDDTKYLRDTQDKIIKILKLEKQTWLNNDAIWTQIDSLNYEFEQNATACDKKYYELRQELDFVFLRGSNTQNFDFISGKILEHHKQCDNMTYRYWEQHRNLTNQITYCKECASIIDRIAP